MGIRRLLLGLAIGLVALFAVPALSQAHTINENGTKWSPNNNPVGCFRTYLQFGESGGGGIHMDVLHQFWSHSCSSSPDWGTSAGVTGASLMMLLKNTGTGPYGGWSVCQSWIVNKESTTWPDSGFGYISRHVDTSGIPCGHGTYALGVCAGPSGYSSMYWANHSTYVRNCADNYVNWVFSNGTHDF